MVFWLAVSLIAFSPAYLVYIFLRPDRVKDASPLLFLFLTFSTAFNSSVYFKPPNEDFFVGFAHALFSITCLITFFWIKRLNRKTIKVRA